MNDEKDESIDNEPVVPKFGEGEDLLRPSRDLEEKKKEPGFVKKFLKKRKEKLKKIPRWKRRRRLAKQIIAVLLIVFFIGYSKIVYGFISVARQDSDFAWFSLEYVKMLSFYVLAGVPLLLVLGFLCLVVMVKTRWDAERKLYEDPDINQWLVCFNWSKNILHLPTVIFSAALAFAIWKNPSHIRIFSTIWCFVFIVCEIIKDKDLSLWKLLSVFIFFAFLGIGFVSIEKIDWVGRQFMKINIQVSSHFMILIGIYFLLDICACFIIGVFWYYRFEPNQLVVEKGMAQNADLLDREDYNATVETTNDFIEWLLGMGKIRVEFKVGNRQPKEIYVGRIKNKSEWIKSIMGKKALDLHSSSSTGKASAEDQQLET